MEKPFGTDLASARALNAELHEVFDEEQIFRIDHFLGKEAAQNILAFRFANGLFEPIWHRNHIDHIQIDVPETLGLAQRADFYENTGAYRDMVVTHLFQVLAFTAMEPPTALEPAAISEEKNKVFRSMSPIEPHDVVRGQYVGYRDVPGVKHDSQTETFVALKCFVDNWRWAGVPFYLRTGKRLAEGARIISIAFKEPPRSMFPAGSGVGDNGPDHLTFDLADRSRMSLSFYGKRPGPGMKLDKLSMQFSMGETDWAGAVLEAYERLIYDAARGDRTLFTSAEGIERLWEISQPLLDNPPDRAALRPRDVGPQPDPPAGRAVHVATAVRAALARPQHLGCLSASPRARRCLRVTSGGGIGRLRSAGPSIGGARVKAEARAGRRPQDGVTAFPRKQSGRNRARLRSKHEHRRPGPPPPERSTSRARRSRTRNYRTAACGAASTCRSRGQARDEAAGLDAQPSTATSQAASPRGPTSSSGSSRGRGPTPNGGADVTAVDRSPPAP